ncbi:MAG TPA: HAD-IA family hydrolase [Acidimicrobiales bacterium]|nr:HAD-IA family hydrolase [Acidimicrobiales bacterium]
MRFSLAVFDFDGTLLDSDEALVAPFLALGVPRDEVRFGPLAAEECARLGIPLDAYLANYDVGRAQPYPGVEEMLGRLRRWAVASNKVRAAGTAELRRLGWRPEVAMFADDFAGPKQLAPLLARLGAPVPGEVVFVGDTDHDRECARAAGVGFALAAWNPRATAEDGDLVLGTPGDLLALLDGAGATR